jgi:hypothetical protein
MLGAAYKSIVWQDLLHSYGITNADGRFNWHFNTPQTMSRIAIEDSTSENLPRICLAHIDNFKTLAKCRDCIIQAADIVGCEIINQVTPQHIYYPYCQCNTTYEWLC